MFSSGTDSTFKLDLLLARLFTNLVTALVWVSLLVAASLFGLFYYYGKGLPSYQQLARYEPPVLTRFYANDGRLFGEYAWEKRLYVPISEIPLRVREAFLSAEDKNFYHHMGIDIPSVIGAAVKNISRLRDSKRPIGASTITQQVAKNFLLSEISNLVSLERKAKEAILSLRIENAYSKDHIFELYLNEIFLGHSSYGVAAAALNYFNKSLNDLTIEEAAFLAGLPKAPSRYNPRRNPKAAKIRRDYVINRMKEDGHISAEQAAAAKAMPITLHKRETGQTVFSSFFAEEVRREMMEKFGERALYEDGYVVRTTLAPGYQDMAARALRGGMEAYDQRHGWRGPLTHLEINDIELKYKNGETLWKERLEDFVSPASLHPWQKALVLDVEKAKAVIGFVDGQTSFIPLEEMKWARKYIKVDARGPAITHPKQVLKIGDVVAVESRKEDKPGYRLCQIPEVSGAVVVMDPHSGRVLAMQGGFSFRGSQFNRATQAQRQTGSAFKTLVFLAALEKGLAPNKTINDAPFAINMGYGLGVWRPNNYDKKFMGRMTIRRGFELSRNIITIRLAHDHVGMNKVAEIADRLDVIDSLPKQLAMVLGAGETTLLKMTAAHAMIANGGKKITPTFIDRIQNRHGRTVFAHKNVVCRGCLNSLVAPPQLKDIRPQVIDPVVAYQMTSLLEGVVQRGTGRRLKDLGIPLAGKSGTTNDFKDGWFIVFSPDLVCGAYIGFDQPRYMGRHEGGSRVALPVVKAFMKEAIGDRPPMPFRVPPGVKLKRVNATTGRPARSGESNVIYEAFKPTDRFDEDDNLEAESSFEREVYVEGGISGTGGLY